MNTQRHSISFIEQDNDILQPITKFGGQPVWLQKPQWPLSKSLQQPMQFIAQIDLSDTRFKTNDGIQKIAYLFMTSHEDVDNSWDYTSGENAVIIQSSDGAEYPLDISVIDSISDELINKNLLFKFISVEGQAKMQPSPTVFTCELEEASDPAYLSEEQRADLEIDDENNYTDAIEGNKLGGIPSFIQNDEFPDNNSEEWQLLLQLDENNVPFYINFGMGGIGFLFINKALNSGKFLWQC